MNEYNGTGANVIDKAVPVYDQRSTIMKPETFEPAFWKEVQGLLRDIATGRKVKHKGLSSCCVAVTVRSARTVKSVRPSMVCYD